MKIKICGITSLSDANFCIQSSVDFIGFNFYKESPRYISIQNAKKIIINIQKKNTKFVGIFVNEKINDILETISECKLDIIQLHGNETPKFINELKKKTDIQIIKAIRIKNETSFNNMKNYDVDYFLFDTYIENQFGGTNKKFDHSLLINQVNNYFLAGGISIENIQVILTKINPFAVDLNSGVEISPGVKNHKKILKILKIIRRSK